MFLKPATTFLTVFFIGLFVGSCAISSSGQDNKTTQAFQYFNEQNYAAAEPLFKSLIDDRPELLMLYYYYGASRTENRKYSEYDLIQLLNANMNEAPTKINYYLGIQYHALDNWEQAIKYYDNFKLNSTAEEQTELKLSEKIQQCYNKENPFLNSIETTLDENTSVYEDDLFYENNIYERAIPAENMLKPEAVQNIKTIEFKVNSQITYYSSEQFKTDGGRYSYEKGNEKQLELNTALNKLETLRNRYQLARSSEERNLIGQEIIPLETEIYSIKEEVSQFFIQAESAENTYWENATEKETEDFLYELDSYVSINNESLDKQTATNNNNVEYFDPALLFLQDRTETIREERRKSDELIYKIQIGAYSRALPANIDRLFTKLSVLRKIENYTDENGVVVYTTGNLTNYEDAEKMLLQVKQEGVNGAIIVPYYNGKRITLEEAKKL